MSDQKNVLCMGACLKMTTFLLVVILLFNEGHCSFNLFLDKTESYRLLGIPAELYYVRNGVVHYNALRQVLKVPDDLDAVHYTWESSSYPVLYKLDWETSNKEVLPTITMNISNEGQIPSVRETVRLQFACSGTQDAEVSVQFHFELITGKFSENITQIGIKREKHCSKDLQKFTYDEVYASDSNSSQLKMFYIVLCFGCSLFTLLIVCFLAYIVSHKKDTRQDPLHTEQQICLRPTDAENTPYTLNAMPINSGTSTSSNMSHTSAKKRKNYTQLDNKSLDLEERIAEITIQRKRIRLQKIELEGTFGRLFIGTYSKEDGTEEDVIVKTVMDFASSNQISILLREGLTMYGLKHQNIMSVLGVSIDDHTEPFVVYLREGYSNLKKYLQKCKSCQEGITHVLTTQEVVEIALQIICGIQYMHKRKLLHKDLATRNCWIDGSLTVKVADNALSRDLFPNDYHCLGDNENRPVKWLAIESLVNRTFSTASDVWSFGVTLWELTTLGQQPYIEVDPFEIEHYLKDGYRLSQPVNCPDELFAVMAYCWAMSPDERPTFSQLLTCLQDFHNQLNKYV